MRIYAHTRIPVYSGEYTNQLKRGVIVNRTSLSGTGLCVCFQLRRVSRAITQLYDVALQPSGLRSTQFALLVAIAKKGPISITELGEVVATDQTTLSRSLRTLQTMGHIQSEKGKDRRERQLRLTAKGRRVLEKSVPYWRKVQAEVVSRLHTPDWVEIQKSLDEIKQISDLVSEQRT